MRAGELDQRVAVERQEWTAAEDYGDQRTETWGTAFETWAGVRRVEGGREDDNGELFFAERREFRLRDHHDIRRLDRLRWDGRLWRILDLFKDKRNMRWSVTAELWNE